MRQLYVVIRCTPRCFDYALYRDTYTAKLMQLLDAKVSGQAVVVEPVETPLPLLNLMEALRQSVDQVQATAITTKPATTHKNSGKAISNDKPKKAAARR